MARKARSVEDEKARRHERISLKKELASEADEAYSRKTRWIERHKRKWSQRNGDLND